LKDCTDFFALTLGEWLGTGLQDGKIFALSLGE
jgi:hypothetical protein